MFKSMAPGDATVTIEIDGVSQNVPDRISIAAALLYLDRLPMRSSPVSESPRGPFCMMGLCYECLVEVNGVAGQQACQRQVEAGMKIRLSHPVYRSPSS